jgi:hypothetical protein
MNLIRIVAFEVLELLFEVLVELDPFVVLELLFEELE